MFRALFLMLCGALVAGAAGTVGAQINLLPGYRVTTILPASSFSVPGPIGGLEFAPDGSQLFVAGGASYTTAGLYSVPLVRDKYTHRITGFLTARRVTNLPHADGGLQFGPRGTLFFTRYGPNALGQIVGTTPHSAPLPSTTQSVGGLTFVPTGLPNGGQLLVSSYELGDIFTVALKDHGTGTFTPTSVSLFATLPAGSEGMRYVPSGANAGDILFSNHDNKPSSMLLLEIDQKTGLPVGGSGTPKLTAFCKGIVGAEGVAFDPLTNDLLVSTWQGTPGDSIIHITGFPPPRLGYAANRSTVPLTGASVKLSLDAGRHNALRAYIMLGATSGTSPGFTIGRVHVPLNLDSFSASMYLLLNTPLFAGFAGATDSAGKAVGTLTVPKLPTGAIGLKLDFATALIGPLSAASNAVRITVVR